MAKRERMVSRRTTTRQRTPIDGRMGGTQDQTITTVYEPGKRRSKGKFPRFPKPRSTAEALLITEFLAALGIIILRAIADYVPANGGASPGTEKPAKGAHPMTMLAATLAVYFVLSLFAGSTARVAKGVVLLGFIMDLTLLMQSAGELETVAGWIGNVGGTAASNGAGTSQSSGSGPLGAQLPGGGINLGSTAANNAEQAAIRAGVLSPRATIDQIDAFAQSIAAHFSSSEGAAARAYDQAQNPSTGISTRIADLGKVIADGLGL